MPSSKTKSYDPNSTIMNMPTT